MSGGGKRTVVLSDLHLGHGASQVKDVKFLEPLLEDADEVIFNGDTSEQAVKAWSVPGAEKVEELKAMCARLGAEARFLTGNHDPVAEAGWLDLREERVFVTHGDMIFPDVAPWSLECIEHRKEVRELLEKYEGDVSTLEGLHRRTQEVEKILRPTRQPSLSSKGKMYVLSAMWPWRRPVNILRAWLTMFSEAERFVERYRPKAEVFLFGHFHRPGVSQRGGRIYCNTGALTEGAKACRIVLEGDSLGVESIRRDGEGYFRPEDSRGTFRLRG